MGQVRGVFFSEEHAAAAVARLRREGYAARTERDRFAGEDDDEDHAWAVVSDAPELLMELMIEEYDGWLDVEEPPGHRHAPLQLPTAPKRIKRPDLG